MAFPTPSASDYWTVQEQERRRLEELERRYNTPTPPPGGIIIGRITSSSTPAPVPERRELRPGDKFTMDKNRCKMVFKDHPGAPGNEDAGSVTIDVVDIGHTEPHTPGLKLNNINVRMK